MGGGNIDAQPRPPFEILYEDNHLLVIVKPPGLLSQADHTGDMDVLSLAKAYIGAKYQKPGKVYMGLVHRLDRPVGGVMVLARTSKAAARLSQDFREREGEKIYRAVVQGRPGSGALMDYLLKDSQRNQSLVVSPQTKGAKEARLSFETLSCQEAQGLSLVQIKLHTGRSHQIRVQMAHAGYPLYGDMKYGEAARGTSLALWCYQMAVQHPTLKEQRVFTAKLPEYAPWNGFDAD